MTSRPLSLWWGQSRTTRRLSLLLRNRERLARHPIPRPRRALGRRAIRRGLHSDGGMLTLMLKLLDEVSRVDFRWMGHRADESSWRLDTAAVALAMAEVVVWMTVCTVLQEGGCRSLSGV